MFLASLVWNWKFRFCFHTKDYKFCQYYTVKAKNIKFRQKHFVLKHFRFATGNSGFNFIKKISNFANYYEIKSKNLPISRKKVFFEVLSVWKITSDFRIIQFWSVLQKVHLTIKIITQYFKGHYGFRRLRLFSLKKWKLVYALKISFFEKY